MPSYCCVPGCTSKGPGHQFPADKALKKQWIHIINNPDDPITKKPWQPSLSSKVCHKHFSPDDYSRTHLGMSITYYIATLLLRTAFFIQHPLFSSPFVVSIDEWLQRPPLFLI